MSRAESRWGLLGKVARHPTQGRVIVTQVEPDVNNFVRISYPMPKSPCGTGTRRVHLPTLTFTEEEE